MKRGLGVLLVGFFAVALVAAQTEETQAPPTPTAAAVAQSLPTVDQLLDKYIEALGGRPALEKVTSRISKGSFELPELGASGTVTIYSKAPNRNAVIVEVPGFGVVKQVFDGTVAWEANPQSGLTEKSGIALATARRDAVFHRELALKTQFKQLEIKEKLKLGDQDVYMMVATPEEGAAETWYFDAATGLLVRVDTERQGPMGTAPVQASYKDYKDVEGIKTPHRIEQVLPGMTIITKIEDVKQNVDIADSQFAKP